MIYFLSIYKKPGKQWGKCDGHSAMLMVFPEMTTSVNTEDIFSAHLYLLK